jgi:acyl carrier protein
MGGVKGKVRSIIVDKAPNADSVTMKAELGFQSGGYTALTDALNLELGTTLTEAQVDAQNTVGDVITLVENNMP